MKSTNKDNIIETIEEYVGSSPIRPVIIWFHSNHDIDNARRAISEMNGCATCGQALYIDKEGTIQTLTPSGDDEQFIIPGTYNENTKFFLFRRYMEQLRGEYLKYALDLMYETKLPVVYLANNLQIGNLILFTTSNSIRQSTSLFQLNGDLLCNQVVICSIKRQTTKQHKHQG